MLEKIDKFIDKYLNWRIIKNVLLAELFLIPSSLIASAYNIAHLHLLIHNICFGIAVSFLTKAIKEFVE